MLVVRDHDRFALIALAKFQRPQDKHLIRRALVSNNSDLQEAGLRAVRYFPDPEFFPLLRQIHEREIREEKWTINSLIRELYTATVQYKSEESRELIESTLGEAKGSTLKSHSQAIWLALTNYPDVRYEGLIGQLGLSKAEKTEVRIWVNVAD